MAAIVLQFVWIGIGLATNWDPYPFVFLLTCSSVIQLILIFVIAVAQRQLSHRSWPLFADKCARLGISVPPARR